MELKDMQKLASEATDLIDTIRKGNHDSDTTIIHIYEELGEVSRQLYNDKIGREKLDIENLGEEIADCLILLLHLAEIYKLDVSEEIKKKFQSLKKRFPELSWGKLGSSD